MSREHRRFQVFGFTTTHDALAAEDALKSADVAAVPIPTPRALGSLCGIALRVEPRDSAAAATVLGDAGIAWKGPVELEDV